MRRSKEDGDKKLEELREFITTQVSLKLPFRRRETRAEPDLSLATVLQQRTENDLNIAKRKAEREATDQKALCLGFVLSLPPFLLDLHLADPTSLFPFHSKEREIEQLKEQLYRSESRFFQTTSSDSRTRS